MLLDYYNQEKTKYNNMDTQTLPLVPFGKYKGQPITTLMNDTKYLEWCKQQEWFQKFPIVYNICVNQTITTNPNSKTPEHNKLQNMFLDDKNVEDGVKMICQKIPTLKENYKYLWYDHFNKEIVSFLKKKCNEYIGMKNREKKEK